ncbi:hypothetical protein ACJJID_18935 [Microbulbifer sp. CnH-101-G]|uniref:hypothetical protein n=1 Tax=Microbulbifer sp. CnH-101-G TaxID=3243393 RepID=UPI0040396AD2
MLKYDSEEFSSDEKLRSQLRSLPIEEPGEDLEERILKSVVAEQGISNSYSPLKLFVNEYQRVGQLAVAAGFFVVVTLVLILATSTDTSLDASPVYAELEVGPVVSRPVHLVLHSNRQMPGALIRVTLPENMRMDGYASSQVLQWQADIAAGSNRLSLPVKILGKKGAGEILIEVEYGGVSKRLRQRLTHL